LACAIVENVVRWVNSSRIERQSCRGHVLNVAYVDLLQVYSSISAHTHHVGRIVSSRKAALLRLKGHAANLIGAHKCVLSDNVRQTRSANGSQVFVAKAGSVSVAVLKEKSVTLTAALVDQFGRFRDGDRFFFENRNADGPGFSDEDLAAIRATRLSDIITQNTFVSADQIGRMAFESEQCCFSGGNDSPNMMCVRANGAVNLQEVDICDVEDMTSAALAFYPGTVDPSDNVFYDCACQAAVIVSSATSVSATTALVIATVATLFA
jgi:hypothetical protein